MMLIILSLSFKYLCRSGYSYFSDVIPLDSTCSQRRSAPRLCATPETQKESIMKLVADKRQQERRRSTTVRVRNEQNQASTFQFADNRPETIRMKKLQDMMNNSPQVQQLKDFQEMDNNSIQSTHDLQLEDMAHDDSARQLRAIQKKEKDVNLRGDLKNTLEPIQLYTDAGGEKRTNNDLYVVYHGQADNPSMLYVSPGSPVPQPNNLIIATGQNRNIAGFNYGEYHYDPNRNFTNDCLTFAENLIRGVDQDSNRAELRATGDRPQGTDRLFGQTDQQNQSIATGPWVTGQGANPNIGEAYGITRTRLPNQGETPYHVAAVVAQDGVDNVTLEADAGNMGQNAPVFDIYDTTPANARGNPLSLTFEETYSNDYAPSATGVLRQR